jgi:hypothetical protein
MRLMLRGFSRIGQALSQAEPRGMSQVLQSRARSRSNATTMPLRIGHPRQTLKQAHSAPKPAEQVACKGKFEREQRDCTDATIKRA